MFVRGQVQPVLIPLSGALAMEMSRLVDGDMVFETELLNRGFDPKDFHWLMKGTGELSETDLINQTTRELEEKFWIRLECTFETHRLDRPEKPHLHGGIRFSRETQ